MSLAVNIITYMSTGVVVRAITLVTNLVFRRILGPEMAGIWNLVYIVTGYLSTVSIGVQTGSERDIPYWRGKKNAEMERRLVHQMFTVSFLEAAMVGSVFLIYLFFFGGKYRHDLYIGFLSAAGYVVLWRMMGCFVVGFRSIQNFTFLGKSEVVFAVLDLGLIVGLTSFYGLYGQYLAHALGFLLKLSFWYLWTHKRKMFDIGWHLVLADIKPVAAVGFPWLLSSFVWQFMMSVDSLLVAKMAGVTALGYYSLGVSIVRMLTEIPNTVSTVIFPRLLEKFGEREDIRPIKEDVVRYLKNLAFVVIPLLFPLAYFFFPWVVRQFLPKFLPSIPAAKVLLLAALFMPMIHMPGQILILQKRIWLYVGLQLGAGIATAVLVLLGVRGGIVMVAAMAVLSQFLFFSALFMVSFARADLPKNVFSNYAGLLLPGLYCGLWVFGVDQLLLRWGAFGTWFSDLLSCGGGVLLSYTGMSVLFLKAERELGIWRHVVDFGQKLKTL
ncbi:MAG TPA: lipopolysaccharide biosynthesis protein [Elusimicrobiota bacterium]|nr:lipopolysaccharide biosynthesis protein [Elusimicrobiota bacterium]